MRTGVLVSWAMVAGATLVIWGLGGDRLSSETTSQYLSAWNFVIRKTAHAAEYGVLAVLVLRAVQLSWRMRRAQTLALVLGYVLLVAAADEGRQATSTIRQGAASDVALDMTGAIAALALVHALPGRARRALGVDRR